MFFNFYNENFNTKRSFTTYRVTNAFRCLPPWYFVLLTVDFAGEISITFCLDKQRSGTILSRYWTDA